MLFFVSELRKKQKNWIEAVLSAKGWTRTDWARQASVDPSTLSKFFNDPQNTQILGATTVARLESVSPIKAYETLMAPRYGGLAETEAFAYEPQSSDNDDTATAVAAIKAKRNAVDAWVLSSRGLEAIGYCPGDVLLVDLNGAPKSGDIVCAQLYTRPGNAETVFRIFEPPYLVAATLDRALTKPLLIDNDQVGVRGVVIASIRPRTTRKAS